MLVRLYSVALRYVSLTSWFICIYFFISSQEYFNIPLSNLKSVLSPAHISTVRLILQYYSRNKDRLQVNIHQKHVSFFSLLSCWHSLSVIHYTRLHPCWHGPAVFFCCLAAQTVPVHHGVSAVPDPPGERWQSLPGAGSSAGCSHAKWHPSFALTAEQCKCVSNSYFYWLNTHY